MGLRREYQAFNKALCSLYGYELLTLADGDRPFDFDDTLMEDAAKLVYENGGFDLAQLTAPEVQAIIKETVRVLETAIDSGLPHEVPDTIRYALENNTFVFSGFKTFHALREVGLSMLTEKGGIKPFNDFLTDVRLINAQYNHNYLYAEYNHALGAAQMAAKWHDFEQDGDRYNLQYRTAGDDKVREEHAILDGTTLPPSDPFWDMFLPPNGWNCRCTAVQVRKNKYPASDPELAMKRGMNCTEGAKKAIFRYNPGKSLQLFPPKHPYYKTPKEVKATTEKMLVKLRRAETLEYARENIVQEQCTVSGIDTPVQFTVKGIKEAINQPHEHTLEKLEAIRRIRELLQKGELVKSEFDKKDNPMVIRYHYVEISVAGKPSYAVIREMRDGRMVFYTITDKLKT